MTEMSPEALRVMAAAIEDHRVVTPPDQSTPAALAEAIAFYLISSGWTITRPVPHANTP
ncbi:hypothetical protein [Streptomyces goshikiensis]